MKSIKIRSLATLLVAVFVLGGESFAQPNGSTSIAQLFTGQIEAKARRATLRGHIPNTCVPHIALKAEGEPDGNRLVAFTVVDRDGEGLRCLNENGNRACTEETCTALSDLAKDEKTKDRFQASVDIKIKDLDGVRVGVNTQSAPKPQPSAQSAPPAKPEARLEATTTSTCCGQQIPGPQQGLERSLDSSTMSRVLVMAGADNSSDRLPPPDSRTRRDDRDSRRSRDDDETPRRRSYARDDDSDDRYDRDERPSSSRNSRSRGGNIDSQSMSPTSSSNMALMAMMAQSLFSMGNGSMYGGASSMYGGLSSWPSTVGSNYPGSSSMISGLSSHLYGGLNTSLYGGFNTSLAGGFGSSMYSGFSPSLYGAMSPSLTSGFRSPLMGTASLGGWGSFGSTLSSPLLYGNIGSSFNYGSPSLSLFGTTGSSLGSVPSYYGYGR